MKQLCNTIVTLGAHFMLEFPPPLCYKKSIDIF